MTTLPPNPIPIEEEPVGGSGGAGGGACPTADEILAKLDEFPDPVDDRLTECIACEKAEEDKQQKCEDTRKKVAEALKRAGCPSVVRPYKKAAKKKCSSKKKTTKKTSCSTGLCSYTPNKKRKR